MLLHSGRYTIRDFRPDDLDSLHTILEDSAVMEYIEAPFSQEQTASFLQTNGLDTPPRVYALADKEDHVIGQVIFHPWDDTAWEIGWILHRDYWGQGLATAVTKALLDECRSRGIKRCVIECHPQQAATKRIAGKCGFSRTEDREGLACFILDL